MNIWGKFDEQEKAWFEAFVVLPYENMLDFDGEGDEFSEGIHIYTAPWMNDTPFRPYCLRELSTISKYGARHCDLNEKHRVEKFARAP